MELQKAEYRVLDASVTTHNLFALLGATQDGTMMPMFVPTVADIDVEITRGTAKGVITMSMNEPRRPLPTEIDAAGIRETCPVSCMYEGQLESANLYKLDVITGDLTLHAGATKVAGYIAIYRLPA